jgi:hypothetical protein
MDGKSKLVTTMSSIVTVARHERTPRCGQETSSRSTRAFTIRMRTAIRLTEPRVAVGDVGSV